MVHFYDEDGKLIIEYDTYDVELAQKIVERADKAEYKAYFVDSYNESNPPCEDILIAQDKLHELGFLYNVTNHHVEIIFAYSYPNKLVFNNWSEVEYWLSEFRNV